MHDRINSKVYYGWQAKIDKKIVQRKYIYHNSQD